MDQRWTRLAVSVGFGLSGAAALIYEVAWTRSLSVIIGSTTFALSVMLATFMAGLAIGGWYGGKIADRKGADLLLAFGKIEAGVGFFGLLSLLMLGKVHLLYLGIFRHFSDDLHIYYPTIMALCSLVMLPPTFMMGASFPVVSRLLSEGQEGIGTSVGRAYAFNTMGAIAGSLLAGFVLIPAMGVNATITTAGAINIMVGVVLVWATKTSMARKLALASLGLAAVLLSTAFDKQPVILQWGKPEVKILYDKDHREGRVSLWTGKDGLLRLKVGGKMEAGSIGDLATARLTAYLPIAAHPAPEDMLVIGLGVGATLEAAKANVKKADLVEINDGVVKAIKAHGKPGLLDGVEIHIDDARKHLRFTDKTYDLISSAPSYPTTQGASRLFTMEYYREAAERLNPGGIYCQWLPYYFMSGEDVRMMVKTFAAAFRHITIWRTGHADNILLLGSDQPFAYDPDEIAERAQVMNEPNDLIDFNLSRTEQQVEGMLADSGSLPFNTDDRPLLEFHTAQNRLNPPVD